ncbi:hypothetical protein GCM10023193_08200 [Planotetraspora kaengkrachanensis]|uniref:Uncharacterized protein n=1 Tax=Planotetraspora kaengkrachanensis TaxID=575193 RepID=A0A8J3PR93_9ACTN|nr:hypothetical protein Pka01_08600 [Planotetraspora kaengkrachanensis]
MRSEVWIAASAPRPRAIRRPGHTVATRAFPAYPHSLGMDFVVFPVLGEAAGSHAGGGVFDRTFQPWIEEIRE